MHIGVLTLRLSIPQADSLKEKRHAVKSVVERVRNRFNVSAAEVDDLNIWRSSVVGVTAISNSEAVVHKVLENVADFVDNHHLVVMDDYEIEML